ncbi:hypothetical protein CGCSCA4_v000206 [Colletotrichum siamense]|uniref:Uncharacterized protein n=1 Tax=Colletotrichum siamense TaxID=690259 RepID=A0A9P5K7E2_COLSI|nr:hypothetical protein CGCSCA4_v000206 [Colletotrichum siamense]KAF4862082.1 hypothetical protein CGCSCA2_v004024 [Colletotrichum siamense]
MDTYIDSTTKNAIFGDYRHITTAKHLPAQLIRLAGLGNKSYMRATGHPLRPSNAPNKLRQQRTDAACLLKPAI